jgi:hypothetical protein
MAEKFSKIEDTDKLNLPAEVPPDVAEQFIEQRDKKLLAETETLKHNNKLDDVQIFVQSLVDQSEKVKLDQEEYAHQKERLQERMFAVNYDYEILFDLKLGQVEMKQQPIVTDYSNAVMIKRHIVEKLNENIREVGKKKIDALKDMKNYRKGIHLIEWYVFF